MRAASIQQPGRLEVIDTPLPEPAPDEARIRVMASGICGTDVHIFRGEYLGGYPIIPGHEFSGVVEAVGSQVTRFQPGDRVAVEPNIACDNCEACLNNRQNFCKNWSAVGVTRPGAMAQYVTAPEKTIFPIGDLSFEQAAFVEPLSCVLHGLERLGPDLGDRVLILGAGPIGVLLMQGIRAQGASHITVVDRNAQRLEYAAQMGANSALEGFDALQRDAYDVVIDATGALAVMRRTVDFVRSGGKVLLFGVPPAGQALEIEAFQIFHKGLTVLSSFTSLRNSYQAIAMLQSGRIATGGLVSHRLPLEELARGIEIIEQGLEGVRKVQVLPNG